MVDTQSNSRVDEEEYVRRSKRDPSKSYLEKNDVKALLVKIRGNHSDTVILKLKDHLMSDINSVVLDEIISALHYNKICQALYFQNLSKAMNDEQLIALVALLKKKKIWCMNLGENYNVSIGGWTSFCNLLPSTMITHLYVSEHVISNDLKNKIRTNIRDNRKKHDKHCSLSNIHVIERCTNMWWNPINAIRHKFAADIAREEKEREEREREEKESRRRAEKESLALAKAKAGRFKRPLDVAALTPAHTEYWAEGVGEGGDKPWKFMCSCGEKCSSYEHFRYHPVGRMFECSSCSIWSHVLCVLGNICDDDLEELQEVLCSTCRGKFRRQRLHELGEAGITLGPNGIPCIDIVSSSMCEGMSHSDEDCVGDDSQDDVTGDTAAEDISDRCPAVNELLEVDEQHFTDTGSQSELTDTQHCTEISRVQVAISNSTGNVSVGVCTRSAPENVPCISGSKTAVIYSSSSGVHLSLSDQLSQLQSHLPLHHTAGLLHYRSSALYGPQQAGQVSIGTNAPASADGDTSIDDGSYHRIDSLEELKGSLLAYKCIVNAIPSKIDKCSVVSLTDCDDSSSHSSNIDDDILSARCPEVQSSDIMYGGHVALYTAKIPIEEFGSPPLSPCTDPL